MIAKGPTEVIDAGGRLVIPGFNDAHVHFGPLDPDFIELRYTTDPSVITEKVAAQVAKSKPGQIIRGGHWVHELFTDKKWPSKELIDKVSPDNPVLLERADGHSVLVNSYVLKMSGITKETKDPFGGEIQRDPLTGEPTGILKDAAMKLIRTGDATNYKKSGRRERKDMAGISSRNERSPRAWSYKHSERRGADFKAYERLQAGRPSYKQDRYWCTINRRYFGILNKYREQEKRYPRDGNWIRFGYLKAFADGSIGSSTALMFEPYTDNPLSSGLAMWPYEELEKMVLYSR